MTVDIHFLAAFDIQVQNRQTGKFFTQGLLHLKFKTVQNNQIPVELRQLIISDTEPLDFILRKLGSRSNRIT